MAGTDQARARIWLKNAGSETVNFTCSATYYDYDPAVGGLGTQIVSTPQTTPQPAGKGNNGLCQTTAAAVEEAAAVEGVDAPVVVAR